MAQNEEEPGRMLLYLITVVASPYSEAWVENGEGLVFLISSLRWFVLGFRNKKMLTIFSCTKGGNGVASGEALS
jgi:hypothetical protein